MLRRLLSLLTLIAYILGMLVPTTTYADDIAARFAIVGELTKQVGTFRENRAKESDSAKEALKSEADPARRAALEQTLKDNAIWEMGGSGTMILTALTTAAGGNVSASASQFVQTAAVTYLQSLATQQIKAIADGLGSEAARTALQALVGCAGAAASKASCGSGAAGAAASVVLNNLLDQMNGVDGGKLTAEEKLDRKNLIQTLIAGIIGAAGGDAVVASRAAQIEAENNALTANEVIRYSGQLRTCARQSNLGCMAAIEQAALAESAALQRQMQESCGSDVTLCAQLKNRYQAGLELLLSIYQETIGPLLAVQGNEARIQAYAASWSKILEAQIDDMVAASAMLAQSEQAHPDQVKTPQYQLAYGSATEIGIDAYLQSLLSGPAGAILSAAAIGKLSGVGGKIPNTAPIQITKAKFGHTFSKHGQDATSFLTQRAKGSGQAQGQFLDDQAAAQFIQHNLDKVKGGAVSLPVPEGLSVRIINPDGSFSPAKTIRLVPGGNGVKTAYPEP